MITAAPRIGLSLAALAPIASGVVRWAKFGSRVWFDTVASAFIGCFV